MSEHNIATLRERNTASSMKRPQKLLQKFQWFALLSVFLEKDRTVVDAILEVERLSQGEIRVSPQNAYNQIRNLEAIGVLEEAGESESTNTRGRNRTMYRATSDAFVLFSKSDQILSAFQGAGRKAR